MFFLNIINIISFLLIVTFVIFYMQLHWHRLVKNFGAPKNMEAIKILGHVPWAPPKSTPMCS